MRLNLKRSLRTASIFHGFTLTVFSQKLLINLTKSDLNLLELISSLWLFIYFFFHITVTIPHF